LIVQTLSKVRGTPQQNATGWLVYDGDKPLPQAQLVDTYEPLDDATLEPYDEIPLLQQPDQQIVLDMRMSHQGGIK
jgi:iron transport multicopper oxidase